MQFPFKKAKKSSTAKNGHRNLRGECIGIDITSRYICAVLLNAPGGRQVALEKYAIVKLPEDVIKDGHIEDHDTLVSYLQQVNRQLNSKCKNITSSMPNNLTTVQTVEYNPNQTDLTIEEFVEMEVNQTVGIGNYYDYAELPREGKKTVGLLIASCNGDDVNLRNDALKDAGLKPAQVDTDTVAILNAFNFWMHNHHEDLSDQPVALLQLNHSGSTGLIVRQGQILYKQDINLGLNNLVQIIRQNYQVTEDEAANMVFSASKPDNFAETAGSHFNQQLMQEIQRFIQFYQTGVIVDDLLDVQRLFISGYPGGMAGDLTDSIFAQTGVNTMIVNPTATIPTGRKVDANALSLDACLLTVAFGLAVRGL